MKAIILAVVLAGCWNSNATPIIYNRVEPTIAERIAPFTVKQKTFWRDECAKTGSRPMCYVLTLPSSGFLKCGCCPAWYSVWQCSRLF